MHRSIRKRFPRNPYTVKNIDDVSEIDIMDLSSLKKYNDNHRYLLQVIDVFQSICIVYPNAQRREKRSNRHSNLYYMTRNIPNLYADDPCGYVQIRGRSF